FPSAPPFRSLQRDPLRRVDRSGTVAPRTGGARPHPGGGRDGPAASHAAHRLRPVRSRLRLYRRGTGAPGQRGAVGSVLVGDGRETGREGGRRPMTINAGTATVSIDITEAIRRAVAGQDLGVEEARSVMDLIMTGQATPAQIAAWITALRMKGEAVSEIA